jgi:hypothetical protein
MFAGVVSRSLHNANRDAVIDGCTISIFYKDRVRA